MKRVVLVTIAAILLISLCAVGFSSCAPLSLYSEGNGGLKVVTTVFAPFDFAREVGGERVTVSLLQDNGADLHNYTPTSATLDALASADVFIYIGGVSDEAWVDDAIAASGNDTLKKLCLMDYIEPIHAEIQEDWLGDDHEHGHGDEGEHGHDDEGGHGHEGEHGDFHEGHDHSADEHIWCSVRNVIKITEAICDVFSSVDPEGADYYAARTATYTQKLSALDHELEDIFENTNVPLAVIADRFPFVYLFHDYHVPYLAAFSGCSTETNASFDTQIRLIDAVRDNSLSCVFTTESGDGILAKTVAVETGCRVIPLDSMQSVKRADIEGGVTYISIMQKNISVLREVFS